MRYQGTAAFVRVCLDALLEITSALMLMDVGVCLQMSHCRHYDVCVCRHYDHVIQSVMCIGILPRQQGAGGHE